MLLEVSNVSILDKVASVFPKILALGTAFWDWAINNEGFIIGFAIFLLLVIMLIMRKVSHNR